MSTRLITYDLLTPGKDYSTLHQAIKNLGTWWHCLESTWIVVSTATPTEIRDALAGHMDSNDKLAVFGLDGRWGTRHLTDECNKWLKDNL